MDGWGAGTGRERWVRAAASLACALVFLAGQAAHGDEEAGAKKGAPLSRTVVVPAVQNQPLDKARAVLGRVGFRVGNVYEMSRERIYAYYIKYYPRDKRALALSVGMQIDEVFIQSPSPGRTLPRGSAIDLIVLAEEDGRLPRDPRFRNLNVQPIPNAGSKRDAGTAAPAPADAGGVADVPEHAAPPPAVPLGNDPPAVTSPPSQDAPAAPEPAAADAALPDRNPWLDDINADATGEGPAEEIGSPDAPRAATVEVGRVPELLGLDLNDAEQLTRDANMILYVERVAGHPVGRVLRQEPAPGTEPGARGVVKVVVTAGGDYDAETPMAPAVYVRDVDVPNLLDRTYLQAERILEDLGLEPQIEKARTGLPGRVVDQQPAGGKRVPKGGLVRIWIGPGELPKAGPPTGGAPRREPASAPAPAPRAAGGATTASTGAPKPIAPGAGTELPGDAVVPVGFSWRAVKGATAYLLEVEEAGAGGTWLPSARKPAKTTAVTLELERMDTSATQAFRWRVRAIVGGKQGKPSAWIVLK